MKTKTEKKKFIKKMRIGSSVADTRPSKEDCDYYSIGITIIHKTN
jgi:hypothetical protein